MPPFHDVRFHLEGLWLLIQTDARGLQRFDISDAGVFRSFQAVLWCAPAILVGWIFHRVAYFRAYPNGGESLTTFLTKMIVLEAVNWALPVLCLTALALALQFRPLLRTLIVTRNWFAVPLAYLVCVALMPLRFLSDQKNGASSFNNLSSSALSLAIWAGVLVLGWRMLTTIMGGSPWIRGGTLAVLALCQVLFVPALASMMGIVT
jgi:hypothetical protein